MIAQTASEFLTGFAWAGARPLDFKEINATARILLGPGGNCRGPCLGRALPWGSHVQQGSSRRCGTAADRRRSVRGYSQRRPRADVALVAGRRYRCARGDTLFSRKEIAPAHRADGRPLGDHMYKTIILGVATMLLTA